MNRVFFEDFLNFVKKDYPWASSQGETIAGLSPNLVSEEILELPAAIREKALRAVKALHELRSTTAYQRFVRSQFADQPITEPNNFSALMCYDFHLTEAGDLKLIEINTNASQSLLADLLYRFQNLDEVFTDDFRNEIVRTFIEEASFEGFEPLNSVAIIDQDPLNQKLYAEFLLFQELFKRNGIRAEICDTKDLIYDAEKRRLLAPSLTPIDLVYNRDTDFYLSTPKSSSLAKAWRNGDVALSPNPNEYALLADKERLEDISPFLEDGGKKLSAKFGVMPDDAALIEEVMLKTYDVVDLGDRAWPERKKFFFKPKRSFGGKAVYRGSSVSKNVFENQILNNDYVAQELAVPSHTRVRSAPVDEADFKFDLRFFAYQDRVQLALARLYRGQTTNFQTLGGGIAPIRWI